MSDSFINDVINGDAESRAKWGSYALTQVGLGLIGDKGISKVTTLAKGASVAKSQKVFRILRINCKWEIALHMLALVSLEIFQNFF